MKRTIEQIARDVVETWDKWCAADGWDNPEYDEFCDVLYELEAALKDKGETNAK